MIILVILLAWLAIGVCDSVTGDSAAAYYLSCSLVYSAVTVASCLVWYKNHSPYVMAYAGCNFLAALLNWVISYPVGYDILGAFHFGPFHVVAAIIEILALASGGIDAIRYVTSRDPSSNSGGPLHHI